MSEAGRLSAIPQPGERRLAVRVTPAGLRAVRARHPWLFDGAISRMPDGGRPGDLAVIFDERRRFAALGLYDPVSPIRVRILQHGEPAAIDASWLAARLSAAAAVRAGLPAEETTGYRLVHGESDGLPGLVVDRYDQTLVIKLYTAAWVPWLSLLLPALAAIQPAPNIALRLSREVAGHPEHLYGLADGAFLAGDLPGGLTRFTENGLRFEADVVRGQKTGFFLDQRENRARVQALAAGRRTLNVFAYTGGFSLYAARGGAPEVVSVDLSRPALDAADRNFALNGDLQAVAQARHVTVAADAFVALEDMRARRERFGLVIVDPPAFAKRESERPTALAAYARLTRLAVAVTAPAGTLVMSSCSSRVPAGQFFDTVTRAAAAAGRRLAELERTGHPVDHPIGFPEGAYLKCLYARVP